MKKYLMLTIALFAGISLTYAQDEDSGSDETGEFGASAGDITGAILFGRGNFLSAGSPPSAPGSNSNWGVFGNAPFVNTINANSNDSRNIIGGEVRYFLNDKIAIKASGGAILRNSPDLQNVQYFYINSNDNLVQGNDPNSNNATWIPQYGSIVKNNNIETNVNIGGEYHFPSSRFSRLFPYLGINGNYYYSRNSQYDPSVYYDNTVEATASGGASYFPGSGLFPGSGSGSDGVNIPGGVLVYDVGVRSAEIYGLGGQVVAGVDVYLAPGVYAGVETKPASYLYSWNAKTPGPGLPSLEAETHTLSFFAQTFIKIGFIIGSL